VPDVPAVLDAPAPPAAEPVFDPAGDALARMKPLPCEEEAPAPAPAAPGWVAAAPPLELLADWRQPLIVTVFAESLCCDSLELVLGVLGVCAGVDGVGDGGCCAPTPTASAALSIVPKMI
jgi:hypothetical protein